MIEWSIRKILISVRYAWLVVLRNARAWAFINVAVSLISSLCITLQARMLENLINTVADSSGMTEVVSAICLWGFSLIGVNLFGLTNKYINIHITEKLEQKYIPTIIDKYGKTEYVYFEKKDTQDLFQYVTSSSHHDILSLFSLSLSIASSVIGVAQYVIIFCNAAWIIGVISVVSVAPILILSLKATYIEMKQRWTMTTDIRKRYYFQSLFADKNALQEIKIFHSRDYFIDQSEILTKRINQDLKKNLGRVGRLNIAVSAIVSLFVFTVLFLSSFLIMNGGLEIGTYVVLIECAGYFTSKEKALASSLSTVVRYSEKVQYLLTFFELPESNSETQHPGQKTDSVYQEKDEYLLEFSHVSFRYPDGKRPVLTDVSFRIKKGEKVSFVGENGCGKSTIVKLICGLYRPDSGEIRVCGIPVQSLSYDQIREKLTVIFQDAQQYQLSLRVNVGMGDVSRIDDDERIRKALQLAGAGNLINLPNGIDQNLGQIQDDSVDLSGGEWQRVIIARALISSADLLLLDEPAAALDPIAECNLYREIYEVMSRDNKAAILISHRLASGRNADRILVLKDGIILEDGTHEELMELNGIYAEMFTRQQSWYL